jgi:hypothetical protein
MMFGFHQAPAFFQGIMSLSLRRGRPLRLSIYLDDTNVGGNNVEDLWQDTLEAMKRLVAAGFPLNAAKLKLV